MKIKILNLTPGFDPIDMGVPKELSGNYYIEAKTMTFYGGEPHIKINTDNISHPPSTVVIITLRINSYNDIGMLLVAVDALRGIGVREIHLFTPYFPAARQDRRMVPGESLSVKVNTDLINSLSLNSVTIFDPHSEVTPALLNNCIVIPNYDFVSSILTDLKENAFNLVVPDAGAGKKALKLAENLSAKGALPRIIHCDKKRDVSNGRLTGFRVYDRVDSNLPIIIVDDICDGGGTFVGLAEEIKKQVIGDCNLYLAVSHGIFSHGFDELKKHFTGVYTTDSISSEYHQPDFVKVIKLDGIISAI